MKILLKITVVFTLTAFISTNSGWAAPLSVSAPPDAEWKIPSKIEIPKNLGAVQSSSFPEKTDKPFVFYIQDAHAITDAQQNIWKLTAYFQSVYHAEHFLLEGLSGKMDTVFLRTFPDKFIREKAAHDYFSRGEMTGVEMAAMLNPEAAHYEGLENPELYEENTRAYLEASRNQPVLYSEIQAQEKLLAAERNQFYSPMQKELHRLTEDFDTDTAHFFELIQYLSRFQQEARRYPRVKTLLENTAQEHSEVQKIQEFQVEKMAEAFRVKQLGRLSAGDQRFFQEKFQAFRTRQLDAGVFLQALINFGEPLGVKPKFTAELQACLKRNEILLNLQDGGILEEVEFFIRDLENQAVQTPGAKRVLEKTRDLRLLKKLAALELTRKEWEEEVQKKAALRNQNLWKPAYRFYELAVKRDEVFHAKLRDFASARKAKAVVIVAGGFHSQGFENFLKENHYPYAVVMPVIQSQAGKEKYEALIQGDVSWETEIRSSLYDGFMRHAFRQLIAALNPLERSAQIKLWRDEILRALAKQGRLESSGDYTKYLEGEKEQFPYTGTDPRTLHGVIEHYKKQTVDSVWKTFESQFAPFSKDFKRLIESKQLTIENINALLGQSSGAKPSMLSPSLEKFNPSYKQGFLRIPRAKNVPLPLKKTVSAAAAKNRSAVWESRFESREITPNMLKSLEDEALLELVILIKTEIGGQNSLLRAIESSEIFRRQLFSAGLQLTPLAVAGLFLWFGGMNWGPFWQGLFIAAGIGGFGGGLIIFRVGLFKRIRSLEVSLMNLLISQKLIETEMQSRGLTQIPPLDENDSESKMRADNGGQVQHRHENRMFSEIQNGEIIKLSDIEAMRRLIAMFQKERQAYLGDSFLIGDETRIRSNLEIDPMALRKMPDRIFVYDPIGQMLEKRTLDSIFPERERFIDLLQKEPRELKSPFEGEAESFQLLLQGLVRPLLEELGLEDRLDQMRLSFEREVDKLGAPFFHLHFKMMGLGPELRAEDFAAIPLEDRDLFKKAFEFWYPYLYVRNDIDLSFQDETAEQDERLAQKYPAQRLSFYAAALERIGEASHAVQQTHEMLEPAILAGQVAEFFKRAEQDLRAAFPEHSPEFLPISDRLRELNLFQKYTLPLVQILISKYRAEARSQKFVEPRVRIYGGADDKGPGSSSLLLEAGQTKILLDSGSGSLTALQQNPPEYLDAGFLSHAHKDHTGDLPWIAARYTDSSFYTSQQTITTAMLMLEDSASFEAVHLRGAYRRNLKKLKSRFNPIEPKVWYQVTPELKIRFQPASHVLGANLIYIATPYRNYLYTGDFSGDAIRAADSLELLKDFPVDELWEEATYGGTVVPKSREEREQDFAQDVKNTIEKEGKILIPTFAIGRTADVAVTISRLQQEKKIPEAPIFVDGLAAFNLESYMRYLADSKNPEEQQIYALLESNVTFVDRGLRESLLSGTMKGPFIILGGSGSLAGGRALQYFPMIAENPNNAIILVGYQFPDTVGRDLKEGRRQFSINKKKINVQALVQIHDFGAHARQDALIQLAEQSKPGRIFLIHAELSAKEMLAKLLEDRGFFVSIPKTGDVVAAPSEAQGVYAERKAFFDQISAVQLPENKREENGRILDVYEHFSEERKNEVIGFLLVSLNRKSHDQEGIALIRLLVENERAAGTLNPFTSVILRIREKLAANLSQTSSKNKTAVRNDLWEELRRQAGYSPAATPRVESQHSPKRTPAEIIERRRIATLQDFQKNIIAAFEESSHMQAPTMGHVQSVLENFLNQREVAIVEGEQKKTLLIHNEDGGLKSGNVARAIQYYLGSSKGRTPAERWRDAWVGLLRDFGVKKENIEIPRVDSPKAQFRHEARFDSKSVLSLFLPSPEEIVKLRNLDIIQQRAEWRRQELELRFDQLRRRLENSSLSAEEITYITQNVFGPWLSFVDWRGMRLAVMAVSKVSTAINMEVGLELKELLSRKDFLAKHFKEAIDMSDSVVLDENLLFVLSQDPEEIRRSLLEVFRWAGIIYSKKSSKENIVLRLARKSGGRLSVFAREAEKSVKSRKLRAEGKPPLMWTTESLLDFSHDEARKSQWKEFGFFLAPETVRLLAGLKLSFKEILMLLKIFSFSKHLRSQLPVSADGFRVLTGEGFRAGVVYLADLWAQQVSVSQHLAAAA